jgi:hypothetical protein
MADYRSSFSKHNAYTIDRATIEEIVRVAKSFLECDPEINITLQDHHRISDTNLDALLSDPYLRSKRIEELEVDGRNMVGTPGNRVSRSLNVHFEVEMMSVVRVSVSGERISSTMARGDIETILEGAQLWYSPVFLRSNLAGFFVSIFTPIILSGVLALLLTIMLAMEVTPNRIPFETLVIYAGLMMLYYLLKGRLFPKLTFDIGRSATQIQYARYWRNFVFTSLVVGIVLKLVIDRLIK